tara:strand:- start:181 stop:1221 length:1041 start_codon:yes stop_codon:yes gene_type:complete
MNYKVMQRPMFKLGGKAASQGTGITSGLDEKTNYSIGGGVIQGQNMGAREGFKDPVTSQDFLKIAMDKYNRRQDSMDGMNNLINMQALQQASNVLGQETSNNPLDMLVNFAKQGTSIALPALSARKKLELKMNDPSAELGFAKALKPTSSGSQKVFEMKFAKLDQLEKALANLETQKESLDPSVYSSEKRKINRRLKLTIGSSYQTEDELRADLRAEFIELNGVAPNSDQLDREVESYKNSMGFAEGGRVERQMGSPMMGEQPMAQAPQMMAPQQDVAMETQQNSGNQVYAMLRSRLPQEVSDEVVQLISYNKEAFADFASIKNQEDVSSFNDKYGVQLVIDVATV